MSYIKLNNISYVFSNGTSLFSNLTESFSGKKALIGNNGSGKTVLAKIMAGILKPFSGTVFTNGSIYYLEQLVTSHKVSLGKALGIEEKLEALARVEQGSFNEADYVIIGNDWDIRNKTEELLKRLNISTMGFSDSIERLSGGEQAKIAILKAILSEADFLIMDEPTNHLDKSSKTEFFKLIKEWNKGLLIISHDRQLLEQMEGLVELDDGKIKFYGGNYSLYTEMKSSEIALIKEKLHNKQIQLKKERLEYARKLEKSIKSRVQGAKNKDSSGIAPIALGKRKDNSQYTAGRQGKAWNKKLEMVKGEESVLSKEISRQRTSFVLPEAILQNKKIIFEMKEVVLPYGTQKSINYKSVGGERVAIVGNNGSGKSTLLKVLIGELRPKSGSCFINVPCAFINQYMEETTKSSVELMCDATELPEHEVRTRLANINLLGNRATMPFSYLSGGEKLRVMILLELIRKVVPQLLILDEPTNHLDLQSILSLEDMLNSYNGAILAVSHDEHFIKAINAYKNIIDLQDL